MQGVVATAAATSLLGKAAARCVLCSFFINFHLPDTEAGMECVCVACVAPFHGFCAAAAAAAAVEEIF
uniref:Putative secreted protein n=1 Tax=Anopheles darlingi TaxID=43151 RepID=A0A2M4DQ57_ANODA